MLIIREYNRAWRKKNSISVKIQEIMGTVHVLTGTCRP